MMERLAKTLECIPWVSEEKLRPCPIFNLHDTHVYHYKAYNDNNNENLKMPRSMVHVFFWPNPDFL